MGAELEVVITESVNSAAIKSVVKLFLNFPCVEPIIEDEEHFLRTWPRYHSSRTNIKEPTKSLIFHDMKSLFLPEHIVEFTKFIAQLCRT